MLLQTCVEWLKVLGEEALGRISSLSVATQDGLQKTKYFSVAAIIFYLNSITPRKVWKVPVIRVSITNVIPASV